MISRASHAVTVADVMTTRVRTAAPEQSLRKILKALVDERCHHIPIVDDDRVVGMISTTDLVAFIRGNGAEPLSSGDIDRLTAADIMTTDLETIQIDETVDVAIDRIGPGNFHALVVVDERNGLAGIVTHHDLLHYLSS